MSDQQQSSRHPLEQHPLEVTTATDRPPTTPSALPSQHSAGAETTLTSHDLPRTASSPPQPVQGSPAEAAGPSLSSPSAAAAAVSPHQSSEEVQDTSDRTEDDTVTGNWSLEDDDSDDKDDVDHGQKQPRRPGRKRHRNPANATPNQGQQPSSPSATLSARDVAMYQLLDAEYDKALEEGDILWSARYQSVRQSACFATVFMAALLCLGTLFYVRQGPVVEAVSVNEIDDEAGGGIVQEVEDAEPAWNVAHSLLFTITAMTTVGYGSPLLTPDTETPLFQVYTILFIFMGTATLTIMVAQVYQCLALEASRAQMAADHDPISMARRRPRQRVNRTATGNPTGTPVALFKTSNGSQNTGSPPADAATAATTNASVTGAEVEEIHQPLTSSWNSWSFWWSLLLSWYERTRAYLQAHPIGRGVSVIIPMSFLVVIGAATIGPIEGWSAIESLYFAVVSLTTVGFGDYQPTKTVSVVICCLWLPFSVGFMSLFLANIAAFYIRLSDQNIARIERGIRRRVEQAKRQAEAERRAALRRALRGQEPADGQLEMVESSFVNGGGGAAASKSRPRSWSAESSNNDEEVDEVDTEAALPPTEPPAHIVAHRRRPRGFATVPLDENEGRPKAVTSPSRHLFGSPEPQGASHTRRERILLNSTAGLHQKDDTEASATESASSSMTSMKDILRTVHQNLAEQEEQQTPVFRSQGPESEFLSIRSNRLHNHTTASLRRQHSADGRKKPSFALRVLVQERFSEIIATEIAGYPSNIEIKENTLSVTIDTLRETADKWLVPRRARKAFRAVAFETLYFVGEHGLITRGAEALYDLSPFEFHGLFAPLLAALGDAETMQGWLESTNMLAQVDLHRSQDAVDEDPADEII